MKQIAFLVFFLFSLAAFAVDVAPRISDREIIESLAEIKAELRAGQKATDQRFEAVDQRFAQLHGTTVSMFSVLGALLIALFGYIVWDRRTALKPLEERFNRLERDLVQDLQLRNENGSLLTRFIQAMRELAKEDAKVANVMKTFSLM